MRTETTNVSWLPLIASCLGTFVLLMYGTIVTVTLPSIGADLDIDSGGSGFGALQWIVDVYTVALAGLVLGMGSFSDNLGRKRIYLGGLVLFTAATLGCGLADSAGVLIATRALQGIAGAAMFATILPLIGLTYSGRARATAFAIWGAVAGAAGAVGTVAGGILTELLSWRWIFFASLPLCALAIVFAALSLRESPRTRERVDYPSMLAISVAVTALTFAVINSADYGWTSSFTLGALLLTALSVAGFVVAERRSARPIVPLRLFGTRPFLGVLLVAFGYYFAAFGALPELSLWLQHQTGLSSAATSLVLAVQLFVFVLSSGLLSRRLHTAPTWFTLGGGTVLIGVGWLSAFGLDADAGWLVVLPALIITGIGAGVVSPMLPAVAIAAVPAEYGGTAGAAANSSRQLGLALGIAVSGTVFQAEVHGGEGAAAGLLAALLCCGFLAVFSGLISARLLRATTN